MPMGLPSSFKQLPCSLGLHHQSSFTCSCSTLNDWAIAQWLISAPYPYAEHDARWFIDWSNSREPAGLNAKFVIIDRRTDLFLGVVTLIPKDDGRAELGYWLHLAAQKKGYMTEAVGGTLNYARKKCAKLTCFATVDPENRSSEQCLLANGFRFTQAYKREKCRRRGTVDTMLYELGWPY